MRRGLIALLAAGALLVPQTAYAARRFPSTITIRYNGGSSWSGAVSSTKQRCLTRRVKLFDPNGDLIGRTRSQSDGTYALTAPLTSAGFYTVIATRKELARGTRVCTRASAQTRVI